jgi:hypothetical protein
MMMVGATTVTRVMWRSAMRSRVGAPVVVRLVVVTRPVIVVPIGQAVTEQAYGSGSKNGSFRFNHLTRAAVGIVGGGATRAE